MSAKRRHKEARSAVV